MSGVRNLRAMFEQKGSENPPDRGRSPGLSFGSPSPSDSPRPLSKVRTSFVAVEKDGRIGLRRDHSGDSVSVSSRRFSNDTDATTPQPMSERPESLADNMAKNTSAFKTNLAQEPIPESPRQDAPPKSPPKRLAPNPNPDKKTDVEEVNTKLLPSNPTAWAAALAGYHVPAAGIGDGLNGKRTETGQAKTTTTPKVVAPISTTSKSTARAPKSPMTTKPKSPTKDTLKTKSSAPEKKTSTATPSKEPTTAPKKTQPTKAPVSGGKKPAALDLHPSGVGFVKPKPKSPTRPVKLPSSLTTHTASSASKFGPGGAAQPPRQSLSRASGNAQHLTASQTSHRSPSRSSLAMAGTATGGTKPLKRQASTISRPRPSIGPPPKQISKDHPVTKKDSNQVDDSFLARMMRPTQSSSSKTSDKTPVTPPRKQNAPTTNAARKTTTPKDTESSAKKAAARIHISSNEAKEAKAPTAKEIAPEVAQAETAEAAIETAKASHDTATTPLVGETDTEAVQEPVTVPVVNEDPQKVEDVEDVVREATVEAPITNEPASESVAEKPRLSQQVQGTTSTSNVEVSTSSNVEAGTLSNVVTAPSNVEVSSRGADAETEAIPQGKEPKKVEEPPVSEIGGSNITEAAPTAEEDVNAEDEEKADVVPQPVA